MSNNYVSLEGDAYRISGTRVSLDSIVWDYLSGLSPESIADNFDTLTLKQVYGAITYYLSRREEVDRRLVQNRAKFDALRKQACEFNPLLYRKLEEMQRDHLLKIRLQAESDNGTRLGKSGHLLWGKMDE